MKFASRKAQRSSGGISTQSNQRQSSVNSVLYQVENRFCLSQATTPIALIGELLLYTAAVLTLWSMWIYLKSSWPVISDSRHHLQHDAEKRE